MFLINDNADISRRHTCPSRVGLQSGAVNSELSVLAKWLATKTHLRKHLASGRDC